MQVYVVLKSRHGGHSDGLGSHTYWVGEILKINLDIFHFDWCWIQPHEVLRLRLEDGTDVVLGFDTLSGYESKDNPYFGATVGRVANRWGELFAPEPSITSISGLLEQLLIWMVWTTPWLLIMGHTACMVGPKVGIAWCGNRKWWNRGSSLAGSLLTERRWVSPVTKSAMTKATQPGLPRGSGGECDVHPGKVNLAHLDEGDGEHGDAVEHGAPLLLQPGWTSGWQSSLVQPHHKDLGNLVNWSSHLYSTIWAVTQPWHSGTLQLMQSWFLLESCFLCEELRSTSVNQNVWERWKDLFATTHQRPTPTSLIFWKVILEVPGTANTSNPGFDHNLVVSTSFSPLVLYLQTLN